jgi:hypothetical protein
MFTHLETGSKQFLAAPAATFPKMARGFESKSIEQQQAEMMERQRPTGPRLTPEEQERERKRQGLRLSRSRILHELEASENPRRRKMLQDAIAELDRQISIFE